MAWFRKEADLTPKAEAYGGWETQGVAGHTLGHYLPACSMVYAATDEAVFRERSDNILDVRPKPIWRAATAAGPLSLPATYWGSDTGSRLFDILVNGKSIATESLDKALPGEFLSKT